MGEMFWEQEFNVSINSKANLFPGMILKSAYQVNINLKLLLLCWIKFLKKVLSLRNHIQQIQNEFFKLFLIFTQIGFGPSMCENFIAKKIFLT